MAKVKQRLPRKAEGNQMGKESRNGDEHAITCKTARKPRKGTKLNPLTSPKLETRTESCQDSRDTTTNSMVGDPIQQPTTKGQARNPKTKERSVASLRNMTRNITCRAKQHAKA